MADPAHPDVQSISVPEPVTLARKTTHFSDVLDEKDHADGTGVENKGDSQEKRAKKRQKWTLGILADKETDEVPGTVLLLSKYSTQNIPLGLHHEKQGRGRSSSRGSIAAEADRRRSISSVKKTPAGIILNPQPDDSLNDPLNWPSWRRDTALLTLGFYCMLGGGMTPILAAGFHEVARSLNVSYSDVARTTGLYMTGLGVGSVIMSPTAILYGKRPVYLFSAILFILSSVWCAVAPNYTNLILARVFQGISVSPVECLPSATIAEIFFLHERAFRVGIYTLLLLGGKNLIPLISAAIIQGLSWRWVFWIFAMIVGVAGLLLFLFVPETFWDRTPRPKLLRRRSSSKLRRRSTSRPQRSMSQSMVQPLPQNATMSAPQSPITDRSRAQTEIARDIDGPKSEATGFDGTDRPRPSYIDVSNPSDAAKRYVKNDPNLPTLHNLNSPYYLALEKNDNYLDFPSSRPSAPHDGESQLPISPSELERQASSGVPESGMNTSDGNVPRPVLVAQNSMKSYTAGLRHEPIKPWLKTLNPWNGRLSKASWWRVALRPFVLFAYPSVLFSALMYSFSVGWLIVLSESMSFIYANRDSYNFTSLQVGYVYFSPFIGGVAGSAIGGRVSDILVRYLARKNGGVYEPEMRVLMTIPIALSTGIGLMGFGWAAQERDAWIVPTIFFGILSFGCCLGSTTAITFCVDSYRQYAGEALVTLNFSKNIFHGLVWSLFFPQWLEADGPKTVFVAIGAIQVGCLVVAAPLIYIYGKRTRMMTVRKGFMSRL